MKLLWIVANLACCRAGVHTRISTLSEAEKVAHFECQCRPRRNLVINIHTSHDSIAIFSKVFNCFVEVSGIPCLPVWLDNWIRAESHLIKPSCCDAVKLG